MRYGQFEETIVSTLPKGVSKWLRRDLIGRIKGSSGAATSSVAAPS